MTLTPVPTDSRSGLADRLFVGRWRLAVVFCLVASVYLVTSAPTTINDTRATAAEAWNIANFGTMDFYAAGFDKTWHPVETTSGAMITNRFPGTFLPAVPFYWLLGSSVEGVEVVEDIPYGPAGVAAAVLVAIAVVAMIEVLREVVDDRLALAAGLVAAFATPVWSVAGRALWTHTVGIAMLSLALVAIVRERWWLAGGALGWAIFARPTYAIMAAVLGLGLGWMRRSVRPVLGIGIPSAAGMAALSLYTHRYFDSWLPVAGYNPGRVDAIVGRAPALLGQYTWSEQLVGTFFDLRHGVIPYSVFLVPVAVGVVVGWRRSPDWARVSLIAGAAYWILQLRGNRFTGGYDFVGYRFPIDPLWLMTPLLVVGCVALAKRSAGYRRLTMASVAVSLGLMAALVFTSPDGTRTEPHPWDPQGPESGDQVPSATSLETAGGPGVARHRCPGVGAIPVAPRAGGLVRPSTLTGLARGCRGRWLPVPAGAVEGQPLHGRQRLLRVPVPARDLGSSRSRAVRRVGPMGAWTGDPGTGAADPVRRGHCRPGGGRAPQLCPGRNSSSRSRYQATTSSVCSASLRRACW